MNKTSETNKPFTASSLSRAAGIHNTYVSQLCRKGVIPAVKVGNAWIIQHEDGVAWLEERKAKQKQD